MARLWIFGAETQSALEYSNVVGTPTTSTTITNGSGASLNTNGASVAFTEPFVEATSTQYLSLWFYTDAYPASINTWLQTIGTANAGMCTIRMNTDGTLVIVNGASAGTVLATTTEKVSLNTWTQIQIKTIAGTSLNGTIEVIFAGVTHTFTGLTLAAASLIGTSLGPRTVQQNIYWDDIVEDDAAYPGVGTITTCRQAVTGTPTYDAWTKVGADPYWGDTPPSATNEATSISGSTTAQTKLLADFDTAISTFGTHNLTGADKIGALLVMIDALRGTGTAPTSSVRYRYNGADTDTSATFTTSAAMYRSTFLSSPTLANLNTLEVGAIAGAGSVLATVLDVWAYVDFIPTTITTTGINDVTASGATAYGDVETNNTITERGFVWATHSAPTTADNKVIGSGTTGAFSAALTGTWGSSSIYVRTYATTASGTGYGNTITFQNITPVTGSGFGSVYFGEDIIGGTVQGPIPLGVFVDPSNPAYYIPDIGVEIH